MARESVQTFCEAFDSTTEESLSSSSQREISIKVERIDNLDASQVKEISVKIEFAGNVLAQSDPFAVQSSQVDFEMNAFITVEEVTPKFLDDLLAHPILFTVLDCSTAAVLEPSPSSSRIEKDSKKKTSKTTAMSPNVKTVQSPLNVLGICNLNIGDFVKGKTKIRETLILEIDRKLSAGDVVTWVKLPRVFVTASVGDEMLVPESMNKFNNILSITIESAHNLPEYITEENTFEAIIPVPRFGDKTNTLSFPNGEVVLMKESDTKKKWLSLLHIPGRGGRSPFHRLDITPDVYNPLPEVLNMETNLKKGFRIQWHTWRSCLLSKPDCTYFFTKLMKYRVWPVEIILRNKGTAPSAATSNGQKTAKSEKKSKPATTANASNTDHFTAFLNLSPLLYPGITRARVAAQLLTYSMADMVNKFGAEYPTSVSQSSVATVKSKTASERSKALVKETEEPKDVGGTPVVNTDGFPVFIVVEVELWKPFTPKKQPEYLMTELQNIVSFKRNTCKKTMTIDQALSNFSISLKNTVSIFVKLYEKFIERNWKIQYVPENFESAFHKFLCQHEDYHNVRSSLENQVLTLVSEKFGNLDEYEEMLPKIYIYLVQEMYKVTNNYFIGQEVVTSPNFNTDEMGFYADEALEEEDLDLAKDYLLLRISRCKNNPDYWLDYAMFCMKTKKTEFTVEAIKEALTLNPRHQMGLLLYGLIMYKLQNGTVAELTFQVLVNLYPDFAEAWQVFHLFYDSLGNFEGRDVTHQMAMIIERRRQEELNANVTQPISGDMMEEFYYKKYASVQVMNNYGESKFGMTPYVRNKAWTSHLSWTTSYCPPDNLNLRTTVLMISLGFYRFASMAMAKELLPAHPAQNYLYYLAVIHYSQAHYSEALSILEICVKEFGKECSLWELMGHCFYKLEDHAKAISCYEYVMESFNRPDDIHLVHMRMGHYYLKAKKYVCAKKVFSTACKCSPTPRLWKGLGIASLRLKEFEDAEIAFREANFLDNRDAETWAYLALTNVGLNKIHLFQQCYGEAKKRNLNNETLINEIQDCMRIHFIEDDF